MQQERKEKENCGISQPTTENTSINTSRRKALKTIAAGTAVAGSMALA